VFVFICIKLGVGVFNLAIGDSLEERVGPWTFNNSCLGGYQGRGKNTWICAAWFKSYSASYCVREVQHVEGHVDCLLIGTLVHMGDPTALGPPTSSYRISENFQVHI
jgi:hypothetical protein